MSFSQQVADFVARAKERAEKAEAYRKNIKVDGVHVSYTFVKLDRYEIDTIEVDGLPPLEKQHSGSYSTPEELEAEVISIVRQMNR